MIQIRKPEFKSIKRVLRPAIGLALLSMFVGNTAQAATADMTQTWTLSGTTKTPTSTIAGVAAPAWGYPNLPIPYVGGSPTAISGAQGDYRINLNYWNQDILGGFITNSTMTITVDDQSGTFVVKPSPSTGSGFSVANSYVAPGSRPQDNLACAAGPFSNQDNCHWVPNGVTPSAGPIHAPGSFPSIYNGCHYNQCTKRAAWKDGTLKPGAPYPLQVSQITSIPSHWVVDTSARKSTGVFDVAYDIWLDKNPPRDASGNISTAATATARLPASPQLVNQNNGLEIMIWINHGGYTPGGVAAGSIIQPIGVLTYTGAIAGVSGTWEVWITKTSKAGAAPNDWYVVSYVRTEGVDDFEFDSKYFINDAASRNCIGTDKCASPDWWLTSIQAGFEIWADGEGLTSKSFSAKPKTTATAIQGGRTYINSGGVEAPIVYWGLPFNITASCPTPAVGDTATYSFVSTNSQTGALQTLTGNLTRDLTGTLSASIAAPYPNHGDATLTVTTNCVNGGGGQQPTLNLYIDPAGTVKDTKGNLLVGAKVTLYRSDTATGVFTQVPDGSTIMAPTNRANPDATGQFGDFAWDVIAGYYKVRASYGKCYAPGNPSQLWVDSSVVKIPPPVVNMSLIMECPPTVVTNPNYLASTVNIYQDWGAGYCATVTVKNTTTKALDWETSFNVSGNIYQSWNMAYTKSGTKVTAGGIAWNNILQPGETSRDIGFCVTR